MDTFLLIVLWIAAALFVARFCGLNKEDDE